MKIKLKLTNDQEAEIVAKSLQEAFDRNWGMDNGINERNVKELLDALCIVFHYYTGESIE
jgi:hypothetical protein